MLKDAELLTAIDVGTTKVCTILSRKTGSTGFEVLAHSSVPCDGLRKGNVSDIGATTRAIKASVEAVERQSGHRIHSACVGVTGAHVNFENLSEPLDVPADKGVITSEELERIPSKLDRSNGDSARKLIHALPMTFSVDGMEGIRNPLGMHGRTLEVEAHMVTGATPVIDKLVRAVERAGLTVQALVLEPLASGLAVLSAHERDAGSVLVDIGGGTTDVVAFRKGALYYTGVIPVGGYQFTNDIVVTYGTPYAAAEAAKLKYASAESHQQDSGEEVLLVLSGRDAELRVQRREICQLTKERAQELVQLIKLKLEEADIEGPTEARIVLTGGTSNLPGLESLVRRTLSHRVRRGVPNGNRGIPRDLQDPAYSTGVGILMWAMQHQGRLAAQPRNGDGHSGGPGRAGLVPTFLQQFGRLWPTGLFSRKGRI